MLPAFLVPEINIREAGTSAALELGDAQGGVVLVTLGLTRIIEQESIDVSLWGSADNVDWGTKPLLSFPQKFYCGTYQMLLDLAENSDVKHIRAKWQVNRWGKGDHKPLFTAYIFVQQMQRQVLAVGA